MPGGATSTLKGDDMYFSENSIKSPDTPKDEFRRKAPAPVVNQIFSQEDFDNIHESQKPVAKRVSSQLPRIPEQDERSIRSRRRSSERSRHSRRSNLAPD